MKFLKLTIAAGVQKGNLIYINSTEIAFIRSDKVSTTIALSGDIDNFVVVEEHVDAIMDNLSGEKNDFVFSIS